MTTRDVRGIGDQEISNGMKPERPRSEIGAGMAYRRESDECLNRFVDFSNQMVRRIQAVCRDELPNFVKVCERVRVENKAAHERRRSSLLARMRLKASSLVIGLARPPLTSS
jgi:hypothetical protein